MFVRYGQAAMMAAIMTLAGNAVWAQESWPNGGYANGYVNYFQATGSCCKDGKCCKDGACCSKDKKCDEKCTCGKDDKCECCKGKECGCDKCGCKKTTCECCPIMHKLAKRVGIIMVMPASMPLPAACCMGAMGMLPHPPLPPPHVLVPPPLPPPVPFPHPTITVNQDNTGSLMFGDGVNSNWAYGARITPAGAPTVVQCAIATPAANIHITTTPSSDQLEMSVGEGTSVRCKKMTVTIGDNEITVSRVSDRIRIRGEELYATADSLCTDGKERLILDGDAVLHSKKNGQTFAKVLKSEHIELNLSNGSVTFHCGKALSSPSGYKTEKISDQPTR